MLATCNAKNAAVANSTGTVGGDLQVPGLQGRVLHVAKSFVIFLDNHYEEQITTNENQSGKWRKSEVVCDVEEEGVVLQDN